METYKLKFTKLQNEIFRLLCIKTGEPLNQRTIATALEVSPTAISKSIKLLETENLINIKKDKKMNLILIELNRDNQKTIELKRAENLKMISESGITEFLEENFPGTTIILFGSYSYGEDTIKSDVDIAIVGAKEKEIKSEKFDKLLEKEVRINFYKNWKEIHKNLKNNILNGIILVGRIDL
ncbi:MAG: nucleotidyltransferase domain-containing protein [Nanoarchaeota archaeon]|nr:nucleotidyltransferase domain-containing protein [Nanoarchaeota archaeon]